MITRKPARRRRGQLSKLAPARAPSRRRGPVTTRRTAHRPIIAPCRAHDTSQSAGHSAACAAEGAGRGRRPSRGSAKGFFSVFSFKVRGSEISEIRIAPFPPRFSSMGGHFKGDWRQGTSYSDRHLCPLSSDISRECQRASFTPSNSSRTLLRIQMWTAD